MTSTDTLTISPQTAHAFAVAILLQVSTPSAHATTVASCLVRADLRGVDTHGLNRLPGYIARIKAGVLDPGAEPIFTQKAPVMASLDANNTFGFVAATAATARAVEMAREFGVGVVGVKRSGHFGMAANYLLQAVEQGFGAMVFTNASRSMPAWGSKQPLLGTSPFAVGLPGGEMGAFVLDMAPSVVARGKVRKAARRGETIPEGWMLDGEGRNTTDPVEALKGVVLPIGGAKGSGLAMMMEVFGGVMTGAAFGGDVGDVYHDLDRPQGVGHWVMVFRPEMLLDSMAEYRERMDELFRRVRGSEKAADVERIYTPGEIEELKEVVNRGRGIVFTKGEVEALHVLAKEVGSEARLT